MFLCAALHHFPSQVIDPYANGFEDLKASITPQAQFNDWKWLSRDELMSAVEDEGLGQYLDYLLHFPDIMQVEREGEEHPEPVIHTEPLPFGKDAKQS